MKFRYAIVIALVALVAVAGFASADRLPQQVPENQIFTIDTLIDVTGAVSQESQMQWTLDSQYLARSKFVAENNTSIELGAIVAPEDVDALKKALAKFTEVKIVLTAENNISVLDVPDYLLDTLIDAKQFPGLTFNDIADKLGNYTPTPYTDVGYIQDSKLNPTEEIMILTWTDSLRTNGGKLALNENIDFDSRNKGKGLSNLEVEKVFTYASTEGAHLVGAEEWILDVAGNWEKAADSIRCVFASAKTDYFPAFCNVVKAKSELVNINSAQVSTKGAARSVAATGDIPAMLNYQIAVTPDSNSGSGFADGTVKTFFGGSIMEARAKNQIPSATNNWKDSASVTGGIKNFQKTFNYESGFTF